MSNWFKRNGIHLAIIGIFIALCFVYFSPAFQGKVLFQQDVLQAQAMQKEIMDIKAESGKAPLWTNSMFGGMPSYQIWVDYPNNITSHVISFFKTVFPNPVETVLLYLLGAYLLFCVLGLSPWLAAAGAIAFAFSSYNFIIIEAGHSNKAMAIAFFAPIVAGILLTLRRKYLLGAALTALFLAIEIRTNHIQMTYYLFLALLILIGIELYHAYKAKTTRAFFKSLSYLVVATVVAVGVNAGMLWTTYEYGQESIRGKSNLKSADASTPQNGLDREYAYQWSQGIGENITFLIPNAYGGASGSQALDAESEVVKTLTGKGVPADQALGFARSLPVYWGEKPFTSGPFYFGAIVCFLFVLGLFIVKDRIKWWIVGATVLTLFLSFGKNFPYISDIFFNYFPLYNKFRAVESIIVIPSLLIPILAILAVKEVLSRKSDVKALTKSLLYTLYIIGGIILIVILVPTLFFSFKTSGHEQLVQQLTQVIGEQSFAESIVRSLVDDRISIARSDAFRSLLFVLIGTGLMWALIKQKNNAQLMAIGLAIAVLIDMWSVDRRYLNNENFVEANQIKQTFQAREVDQLILRDNSPDYRVLDLTIPTFSSANATYFHKTIGGYHAAKLKRYQELIDRQFDKAINEDVLDMLNTKYSISNSADGQSQKINNRSSACGNAWFVPQVTFVKDAEEEMTAINSFDPRKVAFVHESFKSQIDPSKAGFGPTDFIKLVSYRPDHLVYEYSAARDVVAIFSEIWYDKGWNAYIDGEKIPHFRANYVLRGAQLQGGNHKVEFKFEPTSYYTGETISLIASILLIGGLGFAIYLESKKKKEANVA